MRTSAALGIVASLVTVAAILATPAVPFAQSEADRPDIVMIMLDDASPHDGRLFEAAVMPNLHRRIVSGAIEFTDFHTEIPLCCPARANILSGQHGHNNGQVTNDGRTFDPSVTIATELSDVGYHTMYVGKYLNGYPDFPRDRVDPPGWSAFDVFNIGQGKYYWYQMRDLEGNVTRYRTAEGDYSTDVIADITVQRLREAPARDPVFALVSVFAPHGPIIAAKRHEGDRRCADIAPWAPPSYDEADVSDKPAYVQALPSLGDGGYDLTLTCESLLSVDDLIMRVGKELDRQGRLDDTVFVFFADNGMSWGEHRRVGKSGPYETRIPMYVAWPAGRGQEPRRDDTLLSNIDIAPTLCELAGCRMGPYPNGQAEADGLSFASLLRDEPYPYARDEILLAMPTGRDRPVFHGLRTASDHPSGAWSYTEYRTGERELYDVSGGACHTWDPSLSGDPCQLQNLLAGGADPDVEAVTAELASELQRLRAEVGADPEPVLG